MNYTLSIDPGIRGCGVALFADLELSWAGYIKNPSLRGNSSRDAAQMARAIKARGLTGDKVHLVLEYPQVYRGSKQKGDPNDLLALAAVDACLVILYPEAGVTVYKPRDWKGTVDGDVMLARIRGRLTDEEKARFEKCPKSLEHNIVDACGIGLFALGRLNPRKVFAR